MEIQGIFSAGNLLKKIIFSPNQKIFRKTIGTIIQYSGDRNETHIHSEEELHIYLKKLICCKISIT